MSGHLRGEAHRSARLTSAAVIAIRVALAKGERIFTLATQYRVDRQTIRKIKDGRTWRHLLAHRTPRTGDPLRHPDD